MVEAVDITTTPEMREAGNSATNGLAAGKMVELVGPCRTTFEGASFQKVLELGERRITIKPDGVVTVENDSGREPENWQNSGTESKFSISDDGSLLLNAIDSGSGKHLTVEFDDIYYIAVLDLVDDVERRAVGTEEDVQNYLMENPEPISEALGATFTPIENERKLDVGAIDIFGHVGEQEPVVVELKRKKATPDSVDQLRRYVDKISEDGFDDVSGVLVAPASTDTAREMVEDHGFHYVEFNPQDVGGLSSQTTSN